MSIVKKNTYGVDNDLSNMSANVDLNRLGDDKTNVSINNTTITIKNGSLIEVNGSIYAVESEDYTFTSSNSGHSYIGFDGTTFTTQSSIGTFDPEKQGYYQVDNLTRTLKWYIDQSNSMWSEATQFAARSAGSSTGITEGGLIQYTDELYQTPSEYSGGTYTAHIEGVYRFHLQQNGYNNVVSPGQTWTIQMRLVKNSSTTVAITNIATGTGPSGAPGEKMECTQELYLLEGDTIKAETFNVGVYGGGSTLTGDILANSEYAQFNGNLIK